MSQTDVKILGISGSLRAKSYNTAALRALHELLPPGVSLVEADISDLPLYNDDVREQGWPAPVERLRKQIAEVDAIIFSTPEYNYSVPGVLKNAIDWASRPAFASPLKGKPSLVVTSSPGALGGVRAQAQVRDALAATLARPLSRPHVAIPVIGSRFRDGELVDATALELLDGAVADLLQEVRLIRAATEAA